MSGAKDWDQSVIEEKWRRIWEEKRAFEADAQEGRPKVFLTFPYPYMNGPLHIGHGFTACRVDVYARFKRMQGYNVLFPWAWHWTGQPIVAAAERLAKGDPAMIREFKEIDKVPEQELDRFKDPVHMARYYTDRGKEVVKAMGFSVDWRREFHTTNLHGAFSKFVEWQYLKLRDRGYVTRGTHPVVWCPRDQSPTGDHDRLEGAGVSYEEYILVKFRLDDDHHYLPAATFRPETIFGVTNLWINPDVEYVEASVDGEAWIISKEAAEKLKEQLKRVEVKGALRGRELIGRVCREPWADRELLILPGWFVKPDNGSGVVYSVPAHAPFDYVALKELQEHPERLEPFGLSAGAIEAIAPISMIRVEGYGEFPAIEVVERMGIREQTDPRCEEATKEVYRREFHTGVLKPICGPYAGRRVAEVKAQIVEDFRRKGVVDLMYDLPEPVICRCTTRCLVKVLEDQWFLRYSDREWKDRTRELLFRLKVYPEEARRWFEDVIEWYKDWPCARRVGLGTPLPWQRDWIVETLSDSTVYMAFYPIAHIIKEEGIEPPQLLPEVFDYVYYGEPSIDKVSEATGIRREVLERMRREFLYWYPLDLRNSAKELLPNHLTFFLFHHAALFGPEHWPRGVGVNGMMMMEGAKMSKSKGNIVTLRDAIDRYGADVVRCALLASSEGMDDADWRTRNVEDLKAKLSEFSRFFMELLTRSEKREGKGSVDSWLLSTLQRRVKSITEALEALKTRTAFQIAFFDIWNDARWYLRRVEVPSREVVEHLLSTWVRLLAPFMPFTAEELNSKLKDDHELVSLAAWPRVEEDLIDEGAEVGEWLLRRLLEDVREVLKLVGKKEALNIYVAPMAYYELFKVLLEKRLAGENLQAAMREILQRGYYGMEKERLASLLQALIRRINELGYEMVSKLARVGVIREIEVLREAAGFLTKELGLEVRILSGEEVGLRDPKGKAKNALPTKPAFYLE